MGFRLTLPGGAVVECESAEEAAKLLAALAASAPAPAPRRLPRPGCIIPSGRGFYFLAWRDRQRHRSPTFTTREEADRQREAFLAGGAMPPRQPRRSEACGLCDEAGHRATRCPNVDPATRPPPPRGRVVTPGRPVGCIESHRDRGFRFVVQVGGNITRSPIYPGREAAELARTAYVEGKPFPAAPPRRRPGPKPKVAAAAPAPPADGQPPELPPKRVYHCGRCGSSDHTAKRHDRAIAAAPPLPAPDLPPERQAATSGFGLSDEAGKQEPRADDEHGNEGVRAHGARGEIIDESRATDAETTGFSPVAEPTARAARGPRLCRRCHQPGHRSDTCDLDLTAARLQDIAAAAVRLGLAPPPEPRAPLPVRAPDAPPTPSGPRWDRDDPDQDLTDLDLGVPELPAAPPVLEPAAPAAPVVVAPPPFVDLASPPDDAPAVPALERARRRLAARSNGEGPRVGSRVSVTLSGELTKEERDAGRLLQPPPGETRPRTRGDCGTERPCPFVSCSQHLYLDVNEIGNLVINDPQVDVWEMGESCALDVADRGEQTLEDIARMMGGLARERVRQIEEVALLKIKRHSGDDLEQTAERRGTPLAEAIGD